MRAFIPWLLVAAAFAQDAKFNGRWNISIDNEPRRRAWWLEVNGTSGRFVSALAGDMNPIKDLAIKDGELTFSFLRDGQPMQFRAKLEGDTLVGTRVIGAETLHWVGRRAPKIRDRDAGAWGRGKPVELFNGKDLSGWLPQIPGKPLGWTARDGVMTNSAGANNLVSEKKFWNFLLHAEYRIGEHSNSGIGLRARYEVQILADYGRPVNTHSHGALYSRIAPTVNATRPLGEWQTMDIRLVGREVTVVLNGQKVIDKQEVEGPTAITIDPDEAAPGPIMLQGDHREVEFRSLVVTPLVRR
ncbi:MAG: DUF1080 domain-containing protein [Acidobacteria bacterium]|nr:DUF1080 domain-containing protein [Acidobacteriota bacterium]